MMNRGVGKFLGTDFEGAYLIKQLKVKYPDKTIIAYTANPYEATFEQFLDYAVQTIPKGAYDILYCRIKIFSYKILNL